MSRNKYEPDALPYVVRRQRPGLPQGCVAAARIICMQTVQDGGKTGSLRRETPS